MTVALLVVVLEDVLFAVAVVQHAVRAVVVLVAVLVTAVAQGR